MLQAKPGKSDKQQQYKIELTKPGDHFLAELCTGFGYKALVRLRECWRQVQAEVGKEQQDQSSPNLAEAF